MSVSPFETMLTGDDDILRESNIPRRLRRAQLNGVSKGGEHPLWSPARLIPAGEMASLLILAF